MKNVNEQLGFDIDQLTDQQLVDLYSKLRISIPKQKSDCNKKVKAEIDAKKQRKAQRKARAKQRGYVTDGFLMFCLLIAFILILFTMAVNA
tara:strand:- start:34449 stop:34721 length:273 start_codon:yes stop_codon:yes gene_type:complete